MSTNGIVFSGLASGLDTQAIISALLQIEQRPIQALESKKSTLQTQLRLFGDLESRLKDLQDSADDVRQSTNFLEFAATLDRETSLTASASPDAIAGTYTLSVDQLARGQTSQSGSYAESTTTAVSGTGTLTFTVDGESFDVDLEDATLSDVATAINAAGEDVSAQVVQVSSGDYRLLVTGDLGSDSAFTVSGSGGATTLAGELTANTLQSAQDSLVTINGLQVTRSTNSITDAIQGVTLDLVAEDTGGATSLLSVSADSSATADKVKSFVDKYNSFIDFVEAQGELDSEGKPKSELFGDVTLRTVRSTLRSITGGDAQTGNQAYTLLSQVGITAEQNGKLTFSRSEFEEAVAADEDAVEELFAGTNGIATQLYTQVDSYLDTVDGLLVSRKNGFNTRIRDADRQIEQAERRLQDFQVSLERKYANLEVLMGRLQNQGATLGGLRAPS